MKYEFVIIGASKAGLSAAETLRERNPDARILLINGEDRYPYKRTHLTKKMAAGFGKEDFALQKPGWYAEQGIDLLNGITVSSVFPDSRELVCSDGSRYGWGKLLLATGAVPFHPDIPGWEHVHHLRTAEDTERIRNLLESCKRVTVLGLGVEAVEIAEQCCRMGLDVVLAGRDSRIMERWLDETLSAKLLGLLKQEGIDCRLSQNISKLSRQGSVYTVFSDGELMETDLILASTGIRGNPSLALPLGIYGDRGILCNLRLETGLPDIYAAGDAVESLPGWPRGLWHWAEYQGRTAALNMSGESESLENRATRLKCEPFGKFYFSMALQDLREDDKGTVYSDSEEVYLKIFERQGRSVAALMEGLSKDQSKILEKGILLGEPSEEIAHRIL
ncbi:MAG: FAD-dependent oxidoreductase [Spirochaetales bacterium]|nr:FAD-dependent oxidoreductase [Spirochaetales bacterium]